MKRGWKKKCEWRKKVFIVPILSVAVYERIIVIVIIIETLKYLRRLEMNDGDDFTFLFRRRFFFFFFFFSGYVCACVA